MIRLLAIPSILFLISIAAFFLFVPPLLIAMALIVAFVLLITGYTLAYCMSIDTELQPVPAADSNAKN